MIKKPVKRTITTNTEGEDTMIKKPVKKIGKPATKKKIEEEIDDIDLEEEEEDTEVDDIEEDEVIDLEENSDDDSDDSDDDDSDDDDEDEDDDEDKDDDVEDSDSDSNDEENEDEDDEDEEEEEAPKKSSKTSNKDKNKGKAEKVVKAAKKVVEIDLTPAMKLVKILKDTIVGPTKGRRLFDPSYSKATITDTRSANKEINLNALVSRLERNGLDYIFDGLKFATEKRLIAAKTLESVEESVLDCLVNEGTGFAFLNGRFDIKNVPAKIYQVIPGGNMSTPVIKTEHAVIKLNNSEFEKSTGLIYRNENNSSEVSSPIKDNNDDTYTVLEDSIAVKKGDVVDADCNIIKKAAKKTAKKTVKKAK